MTTEEYIAKLKAIEDEKQREITALQKEFAFANNPYNVGDIIEDKFGAIGRILEIILTISSTARLPTCAYNVEELKKDLTLKKRQKDMLLYQNRILRKIEKGGEK